MTEEKRANLERLASLLKGTAPRALIASPGGSPRASGEPSPQWQAFVEVWVELHFLHKLMHC